MTDDDYEEYREDLMSFLEKKADDIVERTRSLKVRFSFLFQKHLSSLSFHQVFAK